MGCGGAIPSNLDVLVSVTLKFRPSALKLSCSVGPDVLVIKFIVLIEPYGL